MASILDTSVVIDLRDGDPETERRVRALGGSILLSIITQVELEGGVYRVPAMAGIRRARLDALLESLPVIAFDGACAVAYRNILETAGYSRRQLLDRMIAAQAIVHRASLITRNPADFRDIPRLELLVW